MEWSIAVQNHAFRYVVPSHHMAFVSCSTSEISGTFFPRMRCSCQKSDSGRRNVATVTTATVPLYRNISAGTVASHWRDTNHDRPPSGDVNTAKRNGSRQTSHICVLSRASSFAPDRIAHITASPYVCIA